MFIKYMEKEVKNEATKFTDTIRVVKTKMLLKIFRRTSEV